MSTRKRYLLIPVTICLALCIMILTGCGDSKVKKQAAQFMHDKYDENFTVEKVWEGAETDWTALVRSEENSDYLITARFTVNRPETLVDDYVPKCVYGNFSKEVEKLVKTFFPQSFVAVSNAYDEYYDFGSDTKMSIKEMNTRCPNMDILIFIEKKDFSFLKVYNAISAVRNAYSDLTGYITVYVTEDETLDQVKEDRANNNTHSSCLIGSSQFGTMSLQGDKISYDDFVNNFNDWGGVTAPDQKK